MYLYNTLGRTKQQFKPISNKEIGLYTCGPTVYYFAHLGNLRAYLFDDTLKRVLTYNGYKVKHVMNITDVGHLTSDADTGQDKLEKGAQRESKTVWEIAEFYTQHFKQDLRKLNILEPNIWLKATETIPEQIALIKALEQKGFSYTINDGVYFDTSKLTNYGQLWGSSKVELKPGARVEIVKGKKNPTDFALWKFSPKNERRQMEWESPWGMGFPGWHTECVVMSIKTLGIPFDIHCGGIDHIQVHHTNELAQAWAAHQKPLANFWLHNEFLNIKDTSLAGNKMSKSEGNIITVDTLTDKNFNPLSFRYLCLTAHYRSKLYFSWESLTASQNALDSLYQKTASLQAAQSPASPKGPQPMALPQGYQEKFLNFINDDLDTPQALALIWKMFDDSQLSQAEKYNLLLEFDKIFGLCLSETKKTQIPADVLALAKERENCRKNKDWAKADKLREQIEAAGFTVEDTAEGPKLIKINNK